MVTSICYLPKMPALSVLPLEISPIVPFAEDIQTACHRGHAGVGAQLGWGYRGNRLLRKPDVGEWQQDATI